MFACPRRALRVLSRPSLPGQQRRERRTFVTTTIQTLSNGFLDLALAIPYPPTWPAYSSTIIVTTLATRLIFTVPFSIWAKRRQWTVEDIVLPQLRETAPGISQDVLKEMKTLRIRGTEQEIKDHHRKRFRELMKQRRSQLYAKYKCSPTATMIIPVVSQLPLFVGFSMMLGQLSQPPTPFDSESFLTLASLAHPDPTAILPITLGLITLANVETSHWFMSEDKRLAAVETEKKVAERRAKGEVVMEPSKIVQSALRVLSVGRIVIGAVVPGSVVLYWVTSAAFGLIQTWIFDWWEARRIKTRGQEPPPPSTPSPPRLRNPPSEDRPYTWTHS